MTYITTHAAKCMLAAWTSYRAHLGKLRCDHAALIDTIDIAAKALDIALERDARTLDGEAAPIYVTVSSEASTGGYRDAVVVRKEQIA